jgi:hypothetical protein
VTIQKKSLISTLNTTKKAIVASSAVETASLTPATKNLARRDLAKKDLAVRNFAKKDLAVRNFAKK